MRRAAASLFALTLVGCDALLGGLDEGSRPLAPADAGPRDTVDAARPEPPSCEGWLPGARYRQRLHVRSAERLPKQPVRFSLDTARLGREGKVRSAASQLVLTSAIGAPVPHLFAGPANADAATLFVSLDVAAGETTAYAYYGEDVRAPTYTADAIFVPGVVSDGAFAVAGFDSWTPLPAGRGQGYDIRVEVGRGRFLMLGTGASASHPVGLCQFVTTPSGRRYAVIFDADSLDHPRQLRVTRNGLDGESIGTLPSRLPARFITAGPIPEGGSLLCFVVDRPPIQTAVDFWVSNIRIAPWAESEPSVIAIDAEERCGPE